MRRVINKYGNQCCIKDEGRPLEIGLQELVSNHLKLQLSKAFVVSVKEKALFKGVRYAVGDDRKETVDEMS